MCEGARTDRQTGNKSEHEHRVSLDLLSVLYLVRTLALCFLGEGEEEGGVVIQIYNTCTFSFLYLYWAVMMKKENFPPKVSFGFVSYGGGVLCFLLAS